MYQLTQLTNTIPAIRNSISSSPLRRGFLLIALALGGFALSPMTRAQLPSPAPDGGYPNQNTAEGDHALFSLTTGMDNTAIGSFALSANTTGGANTATGAFTLEFNTTGGNNNIDIGALGVAGESNTIRIGTVAVQKSAYMRGISGATVASGVTVIVATNGRLGTVQSSARFKEAIKPMDKASEAICNSSQ
jgi:hypothetical protein